MQARYIDYSYIAAMDDVGKNYSVFESESEKSLSDKGCIEEDFAGEKEVNPVLECLLEPVFFGEREVSVNVCTVGEEPCLLYTSVEARASRKNIAWCNAYRKHL